jgi:hypothetical protein
VKGAALLIPDNRERNRDEVEKDLNEKRDRLREPDRRGVSETPVAILTGFILVCLKPPTGLGHFKPGR